MTTETYLRLDTLFSIEGMTLKCKKVVKHTRKTILQTLNESAAKRLKSCGVTLEVPTTCLSFTDLVASLRSKSILRPEEDFSNPFEQNAPGSSLSLQPTLRQDHLIQVNKILQEAQAESGLDFSTTAPDLVSASHDPSPLVNPPSSSRVTPGGPPGPPTPEPPSPDRELLDSTLGVHVDVECKMEVGDTLIVDNKLLQAENQRLRTEVTRLTRLVARQGASPSISSSALDQLGKSLASQVKDIQTSLSSDLQDGLEKLEGKLSSQDISGTITNEFDKVKVQVETNISSWGEHLSRNIQDLHLSLMPATGSPQPSPPVHDVSSSPSPSPTPSPFLKDQYHRQERVSSQSSETTRPLTSSEKPSPLPQAQHHREDKGSHPSSATSHPRPPSGISKIPPSLLEGKSSHSPHPDRNERHAYLSPTCSPRRESRPRLEHQNLLHKHTSKDPLLNPPKSPIPRPPTYDRENRGQNSPFASRSPLSKRPDFHHRRVRPSSPGYTGKRPSTPPPGPSSRGRQRNSTHPPHPPAPTQPSPPSQYGQSRRSGWPSHANGSSDHGRARDHSGPGGSHPSKGGKGGKGGKKTRPQGYNSGQSYSSGSSSSEFCVRCLGRSHSDRDCKLAKYDCQLCVSQNRPHLARGHHSSVHGETNAEKRLLIITKLGPDPFKSWFG